MSRLDGKTIIVTGAAQGIGATLARGLAAEGAPVVIADVLEGGDVAEAINESGGRALACTCDVTDPDSIDATVAATLEAFGSIHGLVNNAALFGTVALQGMFDIDIEAWDRMMAVNVRGPWLMARAAIPLMRDAGGGAVVNIASNRVFQGATDLLHYDASKGAVVSMTRSMAREVGAMGVRVNCIAPGLTMSENVLKKEGIMERAPLIAARRALNRNQEPRDLVGAVLFLLGDDSSFMTGQTIVVDGGGSMR